MKKHPLIFDWSKPEASRRDRLYAVIIVGLLFAFVMGATELTLPTQRKDSEEQAALIRFVDAGMAKSWSLVAEENGPFPGRMERDGQAEGMLFDREGGLASWTDYEVRLRPLRTQSAVLPADIMPKGEREFPVRATVVTDTPSVAARDETFSGAPTLVPYHAAALEWLPEELPDFEMPDSAERTADWLRFLVSLREDGSVAELIPLAGSEDPAQQALEDWLRGIRFKKGNGERWFGLRVDFLNGGENEP